MFHINQKSLRQFFIICALFGSLLGGALSVAAQTTAFTYQGRLTDNAMPANGTYDMQFALYDTANGGGGTQQGGTVTRLGVSVTNGVFTVSLDFTAAPFVAGADRYLEITVRGPSGSVATLAPRQMLTPAPTAIQSLNAATASNANQLGGVAANGYLQTSGSGANLTNLNASNITTGTLDSMRIPNLDASRITTGTFAAAQIPNLDTAKITTGTFADTRLSANVAFRNQANTFTGNQTISGNLAQTGTTADLNLANGFLTRGTFGTGAIPATGAGTRMMFYPNKAAFRAGVITGTQWDDVNVGNYSTALGYNTMASSDYSIATGFNSRASGLNSVAFGGNTTASGIDSTALGSNTTASGDYSTALGNSTSASGNYSTALGVNASSNGMVGSFVFSDSSALSLPNVFKAITPNSFTMRATGGFATVGTFGTGAIPATGAGTRMMFYPNKAAFRAGQVTSDQWDNANIGNYSVAMGYNITASGSYSTAMGRNTTAFGNSSTALGYYTLASGDNSTALGDSTIASGFDSTAFGNNTTASGNNSTALGVNTTASGIGSTAMGVNTMASGGYSTAMGYLASTNSFDGSFVYGDTSSSGLVAATKENQFVVRAQNIWLGKSNTVTSTANRFIETSTGAYLSTSGVWTDNSSVNLKTNFAALDARDVLRKVLNLRIQSWNYKADTPDIRHIGVMAQDFYQAFQIGADNEHITAVDTAGVTMAAIQGLDEKLDERAAQLETENNSLKEQLKSQQTQITTQQKTIEQQQRQIDALVKMTCAANPSADVCRPEEK